MRCWVVALAFCACGDVNKIDTPVAPDAYQPDSPPEVSCAADETVCGGSCSNTMTDELNCGNCGTQCAPTATCVNGTCLATNISCPRVREIDPAAPDGGYRNPHTARDFYCNFTTNKMYEFGLGQHNVVYAGYTLMSVASFDTPTKEAFLGAYNFTGGVQTVAAFTSNTCCITQPNNLELGFGSTYLSLAQAGTLMCNINYNGVYQISKGQTVTGILAPPLPTNFFTTNLITEAATCGDSINIGLFFKVTSF